MQAVCLPGRLKGKGGRCAPASLLQPSLRSLATALFAVEAGVTVNCYYFTGLTAEERIDVGVHT